MSDRMKNMCGKCHRTSVNRVIEVEVEDQVGQTVLGRKVDHRPLIEIWSCPKCSYRQVVGFKLPLDPDQPLLAAYERKFGPADGRAINALINDQFMEKFGEDWGANFCEGSIEGLLSELIETSKAHFGDDWATAILDSDFSFVEEGCNYES